MEIKQDTYKGTRIIVDNNRAGILAASSLTLMKLGFERIFIPIIQPASMFKDKVGEENNNMMYNFKDRGDRDLCLAPEYTAVIQNLAKTTYKMEKDVKLFYIQQCFRGEKPQKGRYREFTQLGVEIINPTKDWSKELQDLAVTMCKSLNPQLNYSLNKNVTRGLDYYNEGKGFEIIAPELGSVKQICGGGQYEGGVGFAIGIDRLI